MFFVIKKIINKTILLSIALFFGIQYSFSFDFKTNCEEKTFIVTAYYSPKSGQAFYYKDTFEDEKALNGEGLYGASGKPVFNGMLAAPSSYNFGELIYFPSLGGVGEIADRGGAIVHAGELGHEYDRIDVWMGTGELGLVKALTWGKQTITGYYCNLDVSKSHKKEIKIGFNLGSIPIMKYFFDSTLFIQELKTDRSDVWVYKLQEYLGKLGYMKKKTGYFGSETKDALCRYQIARGLSTQKYCGTFGSKTRYFMKNEAKLRGLLPDFNETTTIDNLVYYAKNYKFKANIIQDNREESKIDPSPSVQDDKRIINYFTEPYNNGTIDPKIGDLQDLLRHLGFYTGELTNTYDKKTVQAVYDFQIAAGILKKNDKTNPARGRLGPATRNALNIRWNNFKNNNR